MKRMFLYLTLGFLACWHFACQDNSNPTNTTDKDTTFIFNIDTLVQIDTIYHIDTMFSFDTTFSRDTMFSFDTTFSSVTIFKIDTIYSYDTIKSSNTIITRDTIFKVDTIFVSNNTWASVIDSIKDISYMIALRFESNGELLLIGSGFAISNSTIVTNAHVYIGLLSAYIIYKQRGLSVTPVAVRNGQSSRSSYAFPIDTGGYHTLYNDSTVFTHDIGFFKTSSFMQKWINLPSSAEIQKIKVGQAIGTLGYPGETSDRINHIAYATFKDGVVSSLFPFLSSETPTISNSLVVQHNFNTTGGTSGSPIFDLSGNLVAVNNSGAGSNIWDDATGSFKFIHSGSIGYGIRSDDYLNMLTAKSYFYDRISSYAIPQNYYYYPGSRICLSSGTRPVNLGTTVAIALTAANTLFGKTVPDQVLTDGSLWYSDWNYQVKIIKEPTRDNVWAVWIGAHDSKIYLPSFSNFWGITIGTSRNFILSTYGYGYTNSFSSDSSFYYYNYSSLGIGFGFDRKSDIDWNCDGIQIAQTGMLPKRTANAVELSLFPNVGKTEIPNIDNKDNRTNRLPVEIRRIFK